MKFCSTVVEHRPLGVPMIGNTSNGYSLGLTEEGRRVCHRMFTEEVDEAEIAQVSEELLAHLKRGGFDVEREPDRTLKSAYLHVTHHCNLNCVGCYSSVTERNARVDLPLSELQGIIGRLADAGVQRLVISGGEPFLRSDLPAIAASAKEAGIAFVDVLTNGTVVRDETLAELASHVDRVAVSFDCVSGTSEPRIRREKLYDVLTDAVRRIQAAGIPAHIIPTLHAKNADDMTAYCELAERLGATLNFSLLSAPAVSEETRDVLPDEKALVELARKLLDMGRTRSVSVSDTPVNTGLATTVGCGAGCSLVSVSAEGEVYPCHMLHDPAFRIGSLVEDEACLERRRPPACSVDELPGCKGCDIRYLCGGGCRARAFFATGDASAKDPYCTLMKSYYQFLFQALVDHK